MPGLKAVDVGVTFSGQVQVQQMSQKSGRYWVL